MGDEEKDTENSLKDASEMDDIGTKKMVTPRERIHITKRVDGWALKKEDTNQVSGIYQSKLEAIKKGRRFQKMGYDLIIHNMDGTIQKWEKSTKKRTIKTTKVSGTVSREAVRRAARAVIHNRKYKKKGR